MKGSVKPLADGRWTVRWRSLDGRQPRRTFTNKRDAERFLRQVIVDQERDGIGVISRAETIAGVIPTWWEAKRASVKPRTAERYEFAKKIIEAQLGDIRLAEMNRAVAQRFVNELATSYQPRTVNSIYGVLSLILRHEDGKVRTFRKPDMPRINKPRLTIPSKDEVEQLAQVSDARLMAAVILAGYCGLREGEILALHRRDCHDGWILVHHAVNKSTQALESTKTEAIRRVYLPKRVKEVLTEHLDEYPGERVFPFTGSYLQKQWERRRRLVDLESVRFHDLRHAAASMMIHAGWSVTQVAQQLGHSDPAMTLRTYSHLWPASYDEAIKKFDAYVHDAS